jgi:hypothetical protein
LSALHVFFSKVPFGLEGVVSFAEQRNVIRRRRAAESESLLMVILESASLCAASSRAVLESAAPIVAFGDLPLHLIRNVARADLTRPGLALRPLSFGVPLLFEVQNERIERAFNDSGDIPGGDTAGVRWTQQFGRPLEFFAQLRAR